MWIREFECLRQITEKSEICSVSITKELKRIGKNGEETTKIVSWKLQFINSARFMATSLSTTVDKIHKFIKEGMKEFIKSNANMDI